MVGGRSGGWWPDYSRFLHFNNRTAREALSEERRVMEARSGEPETGNRARTGIVSVTLRAVHTFASIHAPAQGGRVVSERHRFLVASGWGDTNRCAAHTDCMGGGVAVIVGFVVRMLCATSMGKHMASHEGS